MSEMIERVAGAIFADDRFWKRVPADLRLPYILKARAVLEAMREPTEEMIEEGAGVIPCGQGVEEGPLNTRAARDCWQEMIDVVLSSEKQPS